MHTIIQIKDDNYDDNHSTLITIATIIFMEPFNHYIHNIMLIIE